MTAWRIAGSAFLLSAFLVAIVLVASASLKADKLQKENHELAAKISALNHKIELLEVHNQTLEGNIKIAVEWLQDCSATLSVCLENQPDYKERVSR